MADFSCHPLQRVPQDLDQECYLPLHPLPPPLWRCVYFRPTQCQWLLPIPGLHEYWGRWGVGQVGEAQGGVLNEGHLWEAMPIAPLQGCLPEEAPPHWGASVPDVQVGQDQAEGQRDTQRPELAGINQEGLRMPTQEEWETREAAAQQRWADAGVAHQQKGSLAKGCGVITALFAISGLFWLGVFALIRMALG